LVVAGVLTLAAALLACGSGTKSETGLGEPLRVRNGTFREGALPGLPPVPPGAPDVPPVVTSFESASTTVRLGQADKALLGRASPDAVAVALRFADLGSGYWVLPVDAPDPGNNGELVWQASTDFGGDLPPGLHPLRVVAIDASGRAGAQRELTVCVTPRAPDNLNACDATLRPPAAVLSLAWDTPADVDLVVVAPDGSILDAKRPRSAPRGDAGVDPSLVGTIDRDSNRGCVIDGVQRENLVFPARPPPGSYLVYASLFDACGAAPVHFRFSLFEPEAVDDAGKTFRVVESVTKSGVLTAVDASGGARIGTFVTEVTF